jgi:hypothetical protein
MATREGRLFLFLGRHRHRCVVLVVLFRGYLIISRGTEALDFFG